MSRHNSVDLDSPGRPFDNIINFRDVGRSINQFCHQEILKEGIFFRSARLDDASERDKKRLAEELNIHTVIDLRSQTEHQMGTRKRRAEIARAESESESESGAEISEADLTTTPVPAFPKEHLLQIPSAKRALISLTGKGFERALVSKLDWLTYLKVIGLITTGYRSDAVRLVCQTVMVPRGLTGLAEDTLEASKAEVRAVFEILAREDAYPTLVHCTQGKDRTGLVVLLILLLVGDAVPPEAIVHDYSRSEPELEPELEERMKEIRAIGLDEHYTKCPDQFVTHTTRYLEKFGGVTGYLEKAGVNKDMQERIRRKLLA